MIRSIVTAVAAASLCACAGTPHEKKSILTPPPAAPVAIAQRAATPDVPATTVAPPPLPVSAPPSDPAPVPAPTPELPQRPKPPAPVSAKVVSQQQAARVVAPSPVVAPKPPAAPVTSIDGTTLQGHIDLVVGPDQTVGAGEVADAVVYFMPAAGGAKPKPGQFQIYTRDKRFDPAALVIPVGSTVSFPNQDVILHNVFSASVGEEFDLGVYGEGASASHTFRKPGLFVINCNVHQAMQSSVLVLDTPYFVHPTKSGDFLLDGVPAGSGKFVIWHPRAASVERTVAIPATASNWTITITKPRVVGHLNKERKSYRADVTQN